MVPGFRVKIIIVNFFKLLLSLIPRRDLVTKKTTPNIDVRPESLGAMLEYFYLVNSQLRLLHF